MRAKSRDQDQYPVLLASSSICGESRLQRGAEGTASNRVSYTEADQGRRSPGHSFLDDDINNNIDSINRILSPGSLAGSSFDYLDKVAKTPFLDTTLKDFINFERESRGRVKDIQLKKETRTQEDHYLSPDCGSFMIVGHCESGHRFGKQVYCGREWCENCREQSHKRRIARWIPKVTQIDSMGYWVITFPEQMRVFMRQKRALSKLGIKTTRALKALGYTRGLRRWHYFGDQGEGYHPHINIIVEGGYLEPAELERQKEYIRSRLLSKNIRKALGKLGLVQDIYYQYHTTPADKYHKVQYITRATFLNYTWDRKLALELRGFRNAAWWGSWSSEPVWSVGSISGAESPELITLEQGICPDCGKPLTWRVPESSFYAWFLAEPLGAGYWRLPKLYKRPRDSVIFTN